MTQKTESPTPSWNYRLVRMDVSVPDEPWYEIREVYYGADGKPRYWTQEPGKAAGSSRKEVVNDLLLMALDAGRRPPLKESQLPGVKPEGGAVVGLGRSGEKVQG